MQEIKERAKDVEVLVLDVDGVLTDGHMIYGNDGEEFKIFYVRDGKGINLAQLAGIRVAFMTSEDVPIIKNRAKKLKVEDVYVGIKNKYKALKEFVEECGVEESKVAFIGDDVNDIPALEIVGFPIAVNDA